MIGTLAWAECVEVIAHRGASGYLPEHTLLAQALGHGQGAHWIEPDVVLTRDGVPVVLHDVTLGRTTNVADVFPDRARSDGRYHVGDFTLAEVARLATLDRTPGRFPHPGGAPPSLRRVLELVEGLNRTTGRQVGVYIELKRPAEQPGLASAVLELLSRFDLPVRIQSFDQRVLASLETEHPRVQLVPRMERLGAEGLDAIAAFAVAVGVPKRLLFRDPSIVERAGARNLEVHVYTLRADDVGGGFEAFEEEVLALAEIGVDAVFADHPDRVLEVLGGVGRACPPH